MYKTANDYYKEKFGGKVYKLSIDAGFTCPNRDGTKGTNGCIFCSEFGSGEFAARGITIADQLAKAKERVAAKTKDNKFIAYFQAFTNTYAKYEVLKEKYFEAIKPDYIVGLSIATRPDCLPESTVNLLSQINKVKPVSVELGFQTSNEKTATYIRRCFNNDVYFDAVKRLKKEGIDVVTHIIIGLPGENEQDALNSTLAAVNAGTDGIKFHLLHVLKNTDLEKEYTNGKFKTLSLHEYAKALKLCIDALPKEIVVHRITGDGAKKNLVAPLWSADKKTVVNYLKKYLDNGN